MSVVMEDNQIVYLLGFSPLVDDQQHVLELAREYTLESVVADEIRCWYKLLDADTFQGAEAEANLQDIEWLTPRILMHEAAVSAISAALPLYPARFGTLFSHIENLLQKTTDWREPLAEFFETIRGRREWGIKLWLNSNQLEQHLLALLAAPANFKGSGSDYLRYRKAKQNLAVRRTQFQHELASELVKAASHMHLETRIRPQTAISGEESAEELVCNISVLASEAEIELIREEVKSIVNEFPSELCMRSEFTGPWAAYSFSPSLL
jgi:hypothetical protein